MPALGTNSALFIKKVRDTLRTGPGFASAQLTLGSGTSRMFFVANDPGVGGNALTVAVTVPPGTSGLTVTESGNALTIALAVNVGVPVGASNTATLISAAVNAASTKLRCFVADGAGAGSLSTAVAATALSGGVGGADGLQTSPLNFLRAQDLATVLSLLMDRLNSGTLTATGGTANSVQDTGAFVAHTQIGNIVTFTGNVTAALAGVQAEVVSNTADALFFRSLPATPASGDTYSIRGAFVDSAIVALRGGTVLGDAPRGNVYGDSRIATNALLRIATQLGGTVTNGYLFTGTTAAGSTTSVIKINTRGGTFRIDELKNRTITVTGFGVRKIISNDETSVTVAPFSSAPAGGVAVTIEQPLGDVDASANLTFAPGGAPRDNKVLAELLRAAEAAVVAFTLPT